MTKRLSLAAVLSGGKAIKSHASAKATVNLGPEDIGSIPRDGIELIQSRIKGVLQIWFTSSIRKGQTDPSMRTQRILHFNDVSTWMQADPHIKYGYRAESNSFLECFWSLFYFHNEFVNIWSHLLPAFFFLTLLLVTDYEIRYGLDPVSGMDSLVVQIYVAGTATCLLLSALFHGTNSHSENVARRCLKLDYLGIVLTISTTCISTTFFALHGHPQLQMIYITLTALCAVAVFCVVLDPGIDGPNAAAWRAAVFTALASSGIMPVAHVAFMEGGQGLAKLPLLNIAITCASYTIGTAVYVYRVPEKPFPGIFDLWGASHQIFHILVAFGQIVHFLGIRQVMLLGH